MQDIAKVKVNLTKFPEQERERPVKHTHTGSSIWDPEKSIKEKYDEAWKLPQSGSPCAKWGRLGKK